DVLAKRVDRGAHLREGQLDFTRPVSGPTGRAFVVLSGGVAGLRPPEQRLSAGRRRPLAALLRLAGAPLDPPPGGCGARRARGRERWRPGTGSRQRSCPPSRTS